MSSPSSSPLIEAKDVTFVYPESTEPSVCAADFSFQRGARVLVIGHNGSGKSTLLALLAGRRKPKSGSLRVMCVDPFDQTNMAPHITLIGSPWPPEAFFANTADRIASPAPDEARKQAIATALHLRLSRFVDKMSSGEKRRVQILHGLLHPATVFLLDECSTDIDVAERRTVLDLVRRESEARQGCCLYATHILDGVQDWATHLLLIKGGRVAGCVAANAVDVPLEEYAHRFMSATGAPPQTFKQCSAELAASHGVGNPTFYASEPADLNEKVITCTNLSFRDVFARMSFEVFRGERVLLCGCNGAGKSTLLNMLGGKQFFQNADGALRVCGKVCYDDMSLNSLVAYGGDWWAAVPPGEVHVHEMLSITTERARRLMTLLAVDLAWDVRHISSGEQKRVQLLFYLLQDKPIVLLDEATADLDVDQRHALLQFLYLESVCRGVTVVYSTHIFGGLHGWANALIILDRTKRGVHSIKRERNGDEIDLNSLTEELIELKSQEVF